MDNTKNEEMIISPLQEDLVISEENLGLGTEIENDDPAFIESNTQGISFEELTTKMERFHYPTAQSSKQR